MADSNVLNLTEYALLEDKPDRARSTAMVFIRSKSVMTDIKVKTENTLKSEGMRYVGLENNVPWVDINQELSTIKNLPAPWAEQMYMTGFQVDLPKPVIEARGSGGESKLFSKLVVPNLEYSSLDFNYKFFNNRRIGASGTDKDGKCFNGIRYRLSAAGRSAYNIPSECKITLSSNNDISAANRTSASVANVLQSLSNALEIMGSEDGENVVFYANENLLSALEVSAIQTANSVFGNDTDPLGRRVLKYRNAVIRRAGRTAPNLAGTQTQIIPNTETSNGEAITGGSATSIFGVKYGEDSFCIKQFKEPMPSAPHPPQDGITRRTVWWNLYGLEQPGTRAIVQISGIVAV